MTEIGVETGGSNVQFAVNPEDGRFVVIEMNPRVSRSSALASKATGYPIAKIAAKLAVGYRLDELENDITKTSAAFEPTIDYVVVKWPRFAFEKFPGAESRLGTQMKSVGEVMAIGRTFPEALQKAARSLETGRDGLVEPLREGRLRRARRGAARGARHGDGCSPEPAPRRRKSRARPKSSAKRSTKLVAIATPDRLFYVADAMRAPVSMTDEELYKLTAIDPWFLAQIRRIVAAESELDLSRSNAARGQAARLQRHADRGARRQRRAAAVRAARNGHGIKPVYRRVDTCAAEFVAHTPYLYSTYETESESAPTDRRKVIILGGGPNRIGQGIEFDYCCVHAVFALRELGFETVMVNCNPETVSTDYDTSDRLYFEPLTFEDTFAICEEERKEGDARRGHRAVRRADSAQARRPAVSGRASSFSAPAPTPSTAPRIASDSTSSFQARPSPSARRNRARHLRCVPRGQGDRLPGVGAPVVRARAVAP